MNYELRITNYRKNSQKIIYSTGGGVGSVVSALLSPVVKSGVPVNGAALLPPSTSKPPPEQPGLLRTISVVTQSENQNKAV